MGEGRGALKGLRKGEGELVRAKKGEKGQDIGGGRRGENFKEGEEGKGTRAAVFVSAF